MVRYCVIFYHACLVLKRLNVLLDLSLVTRAVMECAPHRWYPIGLELGFNDGQLESMVKGLAVDADKLIKIVNCKKMGQDSGVVAQQLLQACETIIDPVIAAVKEKLLELQKSKKQY